MRIHNRSTLVATVLMLLAADAVVAGAPPDPSLIDKANRQGTLRVIVTLDVDFTAEGGLPDAAAVGQQRRNIAAAQGRVIGRLASGLGGVTALFTTIPHLGVSVDADTLAALYEADEVASIEEDVPVPPVMSSSNPVIGSPAAWSAGFTGKGQTVAILDTGVDKFHPWFTAVTPKVVSEACYSSNSAYSFSVCPGGAENSTAEGSGIDCTAAAQGYPNAQGSCDHGTHVAGTAAGNDGSSGAAVGVAKDADIIAVQIFSVFPTYCSGSDCLLTWSTDQTLGLERVYALRNDHAIAAVNMSIGGGAYSSPCDGSSARKNAMDNLASVGIATVVASGNGSERTRISSPACISTAVSVGATRDDDVVASFSNVADFLDVFAPGWAITSAVPGGSTGEWYGTSMATPHVAGAWAVLKQADPGADVATVLGALKSTGTPVDDTRDGGVVTGIPRINVDLALGALGAATSVLELESAAYAVGEEGGSVVLTVNRSGSSQGNVTVGYAAADGSATGGSDYSLPPSTLAWNDTETGSKSITVNIVDDLAVEPDETFTVTLSNPTGDAVLGDTVTATVTIGDNDATPPAAPSDIGVTDNANGTATVTWAGDDTATSYLVQREKKHKKRDAWVESTTVGTTEAESLVDASGTGTFHWRVQASNPAGSSAWSGWSDPLTVTDGSGGGGGGGGGGSCKGRKCK